MIHVDQVGFLPGYRNIGEAGELLTMSNFTHMRVYNVQGLLVTVDFEKVFDTVSQS